MRSSSDKKTKRTERKPEEWEARRRRNWLESIIKQIPAGVAVIGTNGHLILTNTGYSHLLRREEFVSYSPASHWEFDVRDAEGHTIPADEWPSNLAMNTGEIVSGKEIAVHFPNGEVAWMAVSAAPVRDGDGVIEGAVIAFTDITDRKLSDGKRSSNMHRVLEIQEAERLHLARELHDEIGQELAAIAILLARYDEAVNNGMSGRAVVSQVEGLVEHMSRRVRDLTAFLRPLTLEDFGFKAAVEELASVWAERTNTLIDVLVDDRVALLSPNVSIMAYRIVQEALTNAAKHSDARSLSVTIQVSKGWLKIVVEDDGKGFDTERHPVHQGRNFGLSGMRERVDMLNGILEIESAPDAGTRILASIPFDQEDFSK